MSDSFRLGAALYEGNRALFEEFTASDMEAALKVVRVLKDAADRMAAEEAMKPFIPGQQSVVSAGGAVALGVMWAEQTLSTCAEHYLLAMSAKQKLSELKKPAEKQPKERKTWNHSTAMR